MNKLNTVTKKAASLLAILAASFAVEAQASDYTYTLMDVRVDSSYGSGLAAKLAPAGFIRLKDKVTLRMMALPGEEAEAPSFALGTLVGYTEFSSVVSAGVLIEGLAASRASEYRPEAHASLYFEFTAGVIDESASGSVTTLNVTTTIGTLGGAVIGIGVGF